MNTRFFVISFGISVLVNALILRPSAYAGNTKSIVSRDPFSLKVWAMKTIIEHNLEPIDICYLLEDDLELLQDALNRVNSRTLHHDKSFVNKLASRSEITETILLLITYESKTYLFRTLLPIAVQAGSLHSIKAMIQAGADPNMYENIWNSDRETLLQLATHTNTETRDEAIQLLIDLGAKIDFAIPQPRPRPFLMAGSEFGFY